MRIKHPLQPRSIGHLLACSACPTQVQAEQALQSITAAMEQASGHRQEAAVLKNQLAADQVILYIACLSVLCLHSQRKRRNGEATKGLHERESIDFNKREVSD